MKKQALGRMKLPTPPLLRRIQLLPNLVSLIVSLDSAPSTKLSSNFSPSDDDGHPSSTYYRMSHLASAGNKY